MLNEQTLTLSNDTIAVRDQKDEKGVCNATDGLFFLLQKYSFLENASFC